MQTFGRTHRSETHSGESRLTSPTTLFLSVNIFCFDDANVVRTCRRTQHCRLNHTVSLPAASHIIALEPLARPIRLAIAMASSFASTGFGTNV